MYLFLIRKGYFSIEKHPACIKFRVVQATFIHFCFAIDEGLDSSPKKLTNLVSAHL